MSQLRAFEGPGEEEGGLVTPLGDWGVEGNAFSLLGDGGKLTPNNPDPRGEHYSPWHSPGRH